MGRFCIFSREKVIFVNRKMRTMPYDNSAVRRQDGCSTKRVPANCSRAAGSVSCRSSMAMALTESPSTTCGTATTRSTSIGAPDGASSAASTAVTGCRSASWGLRRCVRRSSQTAYESIVLDCRAPPRPAARERMRALELLLEKYSPAHKTTGLRYAEASFARTEIVRLDVVAWSGKTKRVH